MVTAKRHRRTRQRGAAIIVVMLCFAALSALGLFAVRAASLADLASGYNRQLIQTHYIADYTVLALAGDIARDPNKHSANMEIVPTGGNECVGYTQVKARGLRPTCAKYSLTNLQLPINNLNNQTKLVEASDASGNCVGYPNSCSLGPGAPVTAGTSPIEADMKIELTDKHPAWPSLPGNQMNTVGGGAQLGYVMVTISAEGMVRPRQAAANTWDTASATAAGLEQTRAYVLMGPVPQ